MSDAPDEYIDEDGNEWPQDDTTYGDDTGYDPYEGDYGYGDGGGAGDAVAGQDVASIGGGSAVGELTQPKAMSENDSILQYQEKKIDEVISQLHIPKTVARTFLNIMKWDVERVKERFWDEPDELYKECGLDPPDPDRKAADAPKGLYECSLCLEETPDYLQNPGCGHYFCKDCWGRGVEYEIKRGNVFKLKCFQRGCTELVPDEVIKNVVSPEVWEKYLQYLSTKFVDQANDIRWCIAPGCKNAITQAEQEGHLKVGKCPCGTVFCWNKDCAAPAHCPANCEEYKKWQEKHGSSDFQSQKWILENTKKCIKCKSPVSKQDGCFQMTCRPPCSQQFCWLCLEDWKSHSDHFRCKKHPEAGTPSDVGNRVLYLTEVKWEGDELFVKLLDRYNHYTKTQKEAREAQPKVNQAIAELERKKILLNSKPLEQARVTLEECRRIVQGMIVVRGINMNTTKQGIQAFQVKQFEELIQELSNKYEKELLTLPPDFPTVTKFVDDVQKQTKILSNLAQNILSQGL